MNWDSFVEFDRLQRKADFLVKINLVLIGLNSGLLAYWFTRVCS